MSVGTQGFFQPGINLQAWFYVANTKTPGAPDTSFTFRIRRAELRMKGEIIPKLFGYMVMIDPAKTLKFTTASVNVDNAPPATPPAQPESVKVPQPPADTTILQDFFITFMSDYADVSVGEFKIPVSYEGMNSSTRLLFPERALVSRYYGDRRDVGIKAEKQFERFGYVFGVYDGPGTNQVDNNNQKDVTLRIEAYPMKGILLGAVGYTSVGQRNQATTKDRVEGDLRIEIADVLLQAEYIHGWDGGTGNRVEGQGAYGVLGYTFAEKLQPVVRVGFLEKDVDVKGTTQTHYELGFNYYVLKQELKFQAAVGRTDSSAAGQSALTEGIVAAQLAF